MVRGRALAVCLGVTPAALLPGARALAAPPAAVEPPAPGSGDVYGEHLEKADEAIEAGDLVGGITLLEIAYSALAAEQRVSSVGADVVFFAAREVERTLGEDAASLEAVRRALDLLDLHFADLESYGGNAESPELSAFRERFREYLDAQVDPPDPTAPPASTPTSTPPPDEPPEPPPPQMTAEHSDDATTVDREPGPSPALPIGLLASGVVLFGGGIGMLGNGAWLHARNEELYGPKSDDYGCGYVDEAENAACIEGIESQLRQARGMLIGGSIAAAAGVALVATGGVLLVKRRSNRPGVVGVVPAMMRAGAGLSIRGRF